MGQICLFLNVCVLIIRTEDNFFWQMGGEKNYYAA